MPNVRRLKGALCGCRAAGKYREMAGNQSLVITKFRDRALSRPLIVTPDWEIIPEEGSHDTHIRRVRAHIFLDVNGWEKRWETNLLSFGMKRFSTRRRGMVRPYRRLYRYYDYGAGLFRERWDGVPDLSKVLDRLALHIEAMSWKGFLQWARLGLPPDMVA